MVMHCKSGGDNEVMGVMQGKIKGGKNQAIKSQIDTFYVMDSFGLPVEGSETRVNAGNEAMEWMVNH